MAVKKTQELVEIRPIEIKKVKIRIVGDTPLITHPWSAKAKRDMLLKEINATKTKAKEPKNPIEDFASSMYWLTPMPEEFTEEAIGPALEEARFGFPVTGLKQAAISAAYRMGWTKDKASLRGAFYIDQNADGYYAGDLHPNWETKNVSIVPNIFRQEPLIEIHSDTPVMREDCVALPVSGNGDLRYRGQFNNWYADVTISYNTNGQYSLEQIINIINAGGYVCGIGEWRPERDGQYGMFHVEAI